jgi:uncharacterized damage-inducible protein DinB
MNANALRHFYDYHFSENRKVWDTYVSQLSHEQFTQGASYSHGSVRDQIVHLMSVDEVWFGELRGVEPSEPFPPANSDDRESIRAHWDSVEQSMRDYLTALRDDMLFDKRSKTQKKTKTSSCGKCFSMSSIMAQIIAPNFSGYSTIWASRQRIKTTSSMSMATRSCFS